MLVTVLAALVGAAYATEGVDVSSAVLPSSWFAQQLSPEASTVLAVSRTLEPCFALTQPFAGNASCPTGLLAGFFIKHLSHCHQIHLRRHPWYASVAVNL